MLWHPKRNILATYNGKIVKIINLKTKKEEKIQCKNFADMVFGNDVLVIATQDEVLIYSIQSSSICGKNKLRDRRQIPGIQKGVKPCNMIVYPNNDNAVAIVYTDKRAKLIGKKRTDETKRILSEKHKGRVLSEEWKQKLSESAKNRILSDETKKAMFIKMSEAKSKPRKQYKLISVNGTEYVFNGREDVYNFAKDNNLSKSLLKKFFNKGKIISKTEDTKNTQDWEFLLIDVI